MIQQTASADAFKNRTLAAFELVRRDLQVLIEQYGAVLEEHSKNMIVDEKLLPLPKQDMKLALILAIKFSEPDDFREILKAGYVRLCVFQAMSTEEAKTIADRSALFSKNKIQKAQDAKSFVATFLEKWDDPSGTATALIERSAAEAKMLLEDLKRFGV